MGRTNIFWASRVPGTVLIASDVLTSDSPSQPCEMGSDHLPVAEEATEAGRAGNTTGGTRSGHLSPELLQLITNPRDNRNWESIRHLHKWHSQRKLTGLPSSFHVSLYVADMR